jgi:hypothetical protein
MGRIELFPAAVPVQPETLTKQCSFGNLVQLMRASNRGVFSHYSECSMPQLFTPLGVTCL